MTQEGAALAQRGLQRIPVEQRWLALPLPTVAWIDLSLVRVESAIVSLFD